MNAVILSIALGLWGMGFLLLRHFRRYLGGTYSAETRAVSVIIPARNEEHNLPTLLGSLVAQPVKPHEIIVVDDGSTDRTAALARQLRARVIASLALPDGWRGKPWACHQGAQAASGDLLMFVDADTWFEPDGFARILAMNGTREASSPRPPPPKEEREQTPPQAELRSEARRPAEPIAGNDLRAAFSVGPYHAVRKPYEDLSLFFNFNMIAGTVPLGLFGQMLLVDRESYWHIGGHEAVKGRILENFRLAESFRAAGIPVRSVIGKGTFSFRMYPNGLRELVEGWTKGFASGAGQAPRAVLWLVVAWMIGLMAAPLGGVVTGDWVRWGGVYLLCAAQVGWYGRQIGSFRWLTALLYPVPLVFFFVLFTRSALRSGRQVSWKGRSIRAD